MDGPRNGTESPMIRRAAAVDVGSNTLLLLIVEISGETIHPILDVQRVARLGKSLRQTGRLQAARMEKAIGILQEFQQICRANRVEVVLPVATAAVREAENGRAFLSRVRDTLDWEIQLLSGEEEARLSFLGALSNKPGVANPVLVVDIGGASTECVWGSPQKMEGRVSIPIGSVKLTEEFLQHDPPTETELEALRQAVSQRLDDPQLAEVQPKALLGVAGTVTTLAAMQLGMTTYDSIKIDGFELGIREISLLLEKIKFLPAQERLKWPGLTAGREDVILAGTILLQQIMEKFQKQTVIVSDRGLRFGVLLDYLQGKGRWPLAEP